MSSSIRLRGCPRCRGDLFLEHDPLGRSLSCLQCGYTRWLEPAESEGGEVAAAVAVSALNEEKIAA